MRHALRAAVAAIALVLVACDAPAAQEFSAQQGPIRVVTVARGLEHPWGLAFLPDGRMLVTERPGRLRVVDQEGRVSAPVAGVPEVWARGQGGLLDVALAPDFERSRTIYLSFAEPGPMGSAGTAVARARLGEGRVDDVQVVFRQEPKRNAGQHFGSRLVWGRDGSLFVTTGDRGAREDAQDLSRHIGKVIRISPEGTVPRTIPSWAGTASGPRSGLTAIAISRARPSIPKPANSGRWSTAPRAVMKSTRPRPAAITAGP